MKIRRHARRTLLALASLPLLAACSAASGESVASSEAAVTATNIDLIVSPTAGAIAFSFDVPGPALAVTVDTVTQTATTNGTTQQVTFGGLGNCTAHTWSIPLPSGTMTGQTNTHDVGNAYCAPSATIQADEIFTFEGLEHQEEQNLNCKGWESSWPVGYGWHLSELLPEVGESWTGGMFGYIHYSNNSSFCAESTVEAHRFQLGYDISTTQWARGITDMTFTANVTLSNGTTFCAPGVTGLQIVPWPQNAQGPAWAPYLETAETDEGLSLSPSSPPPWVPVSISNGVLSADLGAPYVTHVVAGFASPDDGFGQLEAAYGPPSWAADNDYCENALSHAALTLTYKPLPPETPICTETLDCTTATIGCGTSPEVFQLYGGLMSGGNPAGPLLGTFDGSGTPVFTVSNMSSANSFTACTVNSAGTRACAPVPLVSAVACPCTVTTTCLTGDCGAVPDNCGGTIECGGCSSGLVCNNKNYCSKCAQVLTCGAGHYYDADTCSCVADTCACGGVYPSCKVCQ